MKRETGYYWVKRFRGQNLDWEVAFYHDGGWLLYGAFIYCLDESFAEIDENRIRRTTK